MHVIRHDHKRIKNNFFAHLRSFKPQVVHNPPSRT